MVVLKIGHKITNFQRHKAHPPHFFLKKLPHSHFFNDY